MKEKEYTQEEIEHIAWGKFVNADKPVEKKETAKDKVKKVMEGADKLLTGIFGKQDLDYENASDKIFKGVIGDKQDINKVLGVDNLKWEI